MTFAHIVPPVSASRMPESLIRMCKKVKWYWSRYANALYIVRIKPPRSGIRSNISRSVWDSLWDSALKVGISSWIHQIGQKQTDEWTEAASWSLRRRCVKTRAQGWRLVWRGRSGESAAAAAARLSASTGCCSPLWASCQRRLKSAARWRWTEESYEDAPGCRVWDLGAHEERCHRFGQVDL